MVLVRFGERVRELRIQQNLSQEKFALLAGLDRTYFSSLEKGKRNVSLKNIKKIADALGISMSELLKGVDDNG